MNLFIQYRNCWECLELSLRISHQELCLIMCYVSDVRLERKPQGIGLDNIYLPFVSDGSVSLMAGGVAVSVKIHVLRDTGATQSLLLQGVLLLTKQSSAGASVLVQGVELGVLKVPLHKVYLRSNFVSGVVTVNFRATLPIQGIAFIMGNDLAVASMICILNCKLWMSLNSPSLRNHWRRRQQTFIQQV